MIKEFTVIRSPLTSDEIKEELRNFIAIQSTAMVNDISMRHEWIMSRLRTAENTYSTVNRDDIKVVKNGDRYDISFKVPVKMSYASLTLPVIFEP